MKMTELMINNKFMAQITFAVLLLAAIASKHLNCEALALKPNKANSQQNRVSYPLPNAKSNPVVAQDMIGKSGIEPVPSILSDYYNNLIKSQNLLQNRLPVQVLPQELPYIPYANLGDNEYDTGDEYYSDDNSDSLRSGAGGVMYGNDPYQPEGWFNGPVILDNADQNTDNDDIKDAQLNTLMMAYLLDQFDKLNQLKEKDDKRSIDTQETTSTTTLPSVTTSSSGLKVTTHAIPKKLTAKQIRLVQRGQKEFPLLRPAVENEEKGQEPSNSEWPAELEETNLSQEESLMSLRQQKRAVRDVLTAQLDSLKKEGPKMH